MRRRPTTYVLVLFALLAYANAVALPCLDVTPSGATSVTSGGGGDGADEPEYRAACPCGCCKAPPATSVAGVYQLVPPVSAAPKLPRLADYTATRTVDEPKFVPAPPDTVPRTSLSHV